MENKEAYTPREMARVIDLVGGMAKLLGVEPIVGEMGAGRLDELFSNYNQIVPENVRKIVGKDGEDLSRIVELALSRHYASLEYLNQKDST